MTTTIRLYPDVAGLWMAVFAAVSLSILVGGGFLWRKDKLALVVCLGGFLAAVIARYLRGWDEGIFIGLLLLEASAAGMICYTVVRIQPLRFSRFSSCLAGTLNAAFTPQLFEAVGIQVAERGYWVITLIPFSLLVTGLIVVVGLGIRSITRAVVTEVDTSSRATAEERSVVFKMLAEGKISAAEASQLLKAGDVQGRVGDLLPLTRGLVASIAGGFTVVVGFMLPWRYVNIGDMQGYQAGYHMGMLGWLILLLAIIPAVLSCIPALDRLLRQGMLRLLLAGSGIAFAASFVVPMLAKGGLPAIGPVLTLVGFAIQIVSALTVCGVMRPMPRTEHESQRTDQ